MNLNQPIGASWLTGSMKGVGRRRGVNLGLSPRRAHSLFRGRGTEHSIGDAGASWDAGRRNRNRPNLPSRWTHFPGKWKQSPSLEKKKKKKKTFERRGWDEFDGKGRTSSIDVPDPASVPEVDAWLVEHVSNRIGLVVFFRCSNGETYNVGW